jgi:Mg-chelatase subunit ChlI
MAPIARATARVPAGAMEMAVREEVVTPGVLSVLLAGLLGTNKSKGGRGPVHFILLLSLSSNKTT